MIQPTAGRVVWFFREPGNGESGFTQFNNGPFAALVAHVWNDRMVSLTVFDHAGVPHPRSSTPLLQAGDPKPEHGDWCEWMPYQKGQAARNDAAEAGWKLVLPRPTVAGIEELQRKYGEPNVRLEPNGDVMVRTADSVLA